MKKDCNIVKDLMVLYELDTCSDESVQMINEHIKTCEECKKIWEFKTGEKVEKAVEVAIETESRGEFEKLKRKMRRKTMIKIVVVASILAFILFKGYRLVKDPVVCEYEDIKITNIYKEDDEIGFKVTLADGKSFGEHRGYMSNSSSFGENAMEIEVYRSRFSKKTEEESEITMYVKVPNYDGETKKIYYRDGDRGILIWKEGDPISELTEEIQNDMYNLK